jgi:hypothetical protein
MLDKSDTSVADTLLAFNEHGLDIGFLVPTETAMEKSIMDAHATFRSYLERNYVHKFSDQIQGDKRLIPAIHIYQNSETETKVSVYRPNTKEGDPRVWVYNLKQYATAYNLIGFIYFNETLYIINCSDRAAVEYALSDDSPLSALFRKISGSQSYAATGLIRKLKKISAKGYIPTITQGDTGIGMTLEAELGIAANSIAEPDYRGIELKASRRKPKGTKNRVTLFSKAPNWKLSPVGKAINLLNKRGYNDKDGRLNLYHTLNGKKPNSLGLQLVVDYKSDTLKQIHIEGDTNIHDTSWKLDDLRNSLCTKHPETFWVKADTKDINGREHFHYTDVIYTQSPKVQYLEMLIEDGVITLDYAMHKRSSGNAVRDHGYLFKILPANFNALFPKQTHHDLKK